MALLLGLRPLTTRVILLIVVSITLPLFGAALLGQPIAFKIITALLFVLGIYPAGKIGPALERLAAREDEMRLADARVTGAAVKRSRLDDAAVRRVLSAPLTVFAIIGGGIAGLAALTGIPDLPAGAALTLLVSVPPVALALFVYGGSHIGAAMCETMTAKLQELEQVHEGLDRLVSRINELAGDEGEAAMQIVARVMTSSHEVLTRHADAVSFEVEFAITQNPDGPRYGMQRWANDVRKWLELQPLNVAQSWINSMTSQADQIAAAAREHSAMLTLEVTLRDR